MNKIVQYEPRFKQAFFDLNIAWLEKYFTVEPVHLAMLNDPESSVIKDGGEIFFVLEGETPVGTVAMKHYGAGVYELTKLGVDPTAQGSGLGRLLCETVIEAFQEKDGKRLFLETHSKLKAAMAIYEKLNFKLAENPAGDVYEGTDCYMEWRPCNKAEASQ